MAVQTIKHFVGHNFFYNLLEQTGLKGEAALPGSPVEGAFVALTTDNSLNLYQNSAWHKFLETNDAGTSSSVTWSAAQIISYVAGQVGSLEWQDSVLTASLLTPPGSPATGARYLINGVGTGAWAGQDNNIAEWNGTSWDFTVPTTGTFVAADDQTDVLYLFGGVTWSTKFFEATGLQANSGLNLTGLNLKVDLDTLAAGTFDATADSIAFNDATDNETYKVTFASILSAIAGTGLSSAAGALNVDYATEAQFLAGTANNVALNPLSTALAAIVYNTTFTALDWVDSGVGYSTLTYTSATTKIVTVATVEVFDSAGDKIVVGVNVTGSTIELTVNGAGIAGSVTATGKGN